MTRVLLVAASLLLAAPTSLLAQTERNVGRSTKPVSATSASDLGANLRTGAHNAWSLTGRAASDFLGSSVAAAGDVNGDGIDDMIVGANGYASSTGRAYVLLGGTTLRSSFDVTFTGSATNEYFGGSVAGVGDVNGDGYTDVLVGAHGSVSSTGRAYLFFGGASVNSSPNLIFAGEAAGDEFGRSVSGAGDVNGDGYADLLIGAPGNAFDAGRAYLYFGGPSVDTVADEIFNGESAGHSFGTVSEAGDVNGDGFMDVLVGASGYNSSTGRAYIFLGGPSMDATADVTLTGESAGNSFGVSASAAGDVNGDGYGDIVVGASGYSSSLGRAYVYHGGASMNGSADVVLTGLFASGWFGSSVSEGGDVNGDGYGDLFIGMGGFQSFTGRASVYYGGPQMDASADLTVTGSTAGETFAGSIACVGDVNDDGIDDLAVGATGYSAAAGRVTIYRFSLSGTSVPDERFTGGVVGDQLGASVSSAGDVNGDGADDIIIGAPAAASATGSAEIHFGGAAMDGIADVTLAGAATGDAFGWNVAAAGDVNGDGFDDVIVGSWLQYSDPGKATIFFGGSSMDAVGDVFLTSPVADSSFGTAVSGAGDVNGDGYADVVVGEFQYASNTGRAYVYYGGASMNTTADVTITGSVGYYLGFSVSAAGDMNGDGYDDVIVGAPGYSGSTGRAFVYFGGSSMNNSADQFFTGTDVSTNFSKVVSGIGDVNGDGYDDVVVNATDDVSNDSPSYLFFGGPVVDADADVIIPADADAAAPAGDINGDGYDDLILGDRHFGAAGRTLVYHGGASMDSVADVTMSGESSGEAFGISVASAGDVSGDGTADLIVGASQYSSSTGRAYLFRSWSPPIAPRIIRVKDVPFDQGGRLVIRWARSRHDARGTNGIASYVIERGAVNGLNGFSWEHVANVTPRHHASYELTTDTPNDSMDGNAGAAFFRVTAHTNDPDVYWRSNIVSGYSVDNLAPSAPTGPSIAAELTGELRVSWTPNRYDPDVRHYALYRSSSNGFIPSPANLLATTSDSTWLDATTSAGSTYYYRVTTVDVHGNQSLPSSQVSMAALNVELSSFTVSPMSRGTVLLEWSTASETNNYGFRVERKTIMDESMVIPDFREIGFVPGSGTTTSSRSYEFTDRVAASGRYAYRLTQVDRSGAAATIQEIEVEVNAVPAVFALAQNYPNPFNPTTVIRYDLPADSRVQLTVYNIVGQPVANLVDADEAAGFKEVRWDASGVASGLYFYRVVATGSDGERYSAIRKMVLVK